MGGEWENGFQLSNGTSYNDLEIPLTHISRSRYYSTSHNLKIVQYRSILTMAGLCLTMTWSIEQRHLK